MKVLLSWKERCNLYNIVAGWRGYTHRDLRRVWALMDRLELTDEEKLMVNFIVKVVDGTEREFWNDNPANPPNDQEFEFAAQDVVRIKSALSGFTYAGSDRKHVKSLLDKLLPESED